MFPTFLDMKAMVEASETCILIHEAGSKNILWANPAACRFFNFTMEELKPLKAHHMSSPEMKYRRAIGVAWLQAAVSQGRSRRLWKYMDKEGNEYLTDAVATLVNFQDGPVVMVQFRSVSEDAGLKDELHLVSQSLSRVMALTSAGTLVLDENFLIDDVSDAAPGLLRKSSAQLRGQPLGSVGTCEPDVNDPKIRRQLEKSHSTLRLTLCIPCEDGTKRWLRGQLETVVHDYVVSYLLVFRDDTERIELERQHEYQNANLQYLSRYNAMGDMAMLLAHELGQPLAAARNFSSGVRSRLAGASEDSSITYALDQVERQLDRAAAIVSSVRNYVKRIESTATQVNLNSIVTESMYFIGLRAKEQGIELEVELLGEDLPVLAESVLIGQVMINLCFNAIDEILHPEVASSSLSVRTYRDEHFAYCEVADSGRGMQRNASATLATGAFSAKDDGAGIGLVLSEHIMERHGGQIEYLPVSPSGTCARIQLPLHFEQ